MDTDVEIKKDLEPLIDACMVCGIQNHRVNTNDIDFVSPKGIDSRTGNPFPTALCLLMCVGLIGYMQKKCRVIADKTLIKKIVVFEFILAIASTLSYAEKVYWYLIAYNLGFAAYFVFQRFDLRCKPFEKLGELGFTFFLGAGIPMSFISKFYTDIHNWNCYVVSITQFILAIIFSYMITRWCEKPLLAWGKRIEKQLV